MAPTGPRSRRAILFGLFFTTGLLPAADAPPDPAQAVATTLVVQDAMRQGRELLRRGQVRAAVEALEAQLARINGNSAYLSLLREAYAAYVKELQLAHQDELCAVYQKRLQVLDKGRGATTAPPPVTEKARGVSAEDDPLQQGPRRPDPSAPSGLAAAERAFGEKRYTDANILFARAAALNAVLPPAQRKQWAYCKLHVVVERLRHPGAAFAGLDVEVAEAVRLAENDAALTAFARRVADQVRQQPGPSPALVAIRHVERDQSGWARAESANFKVHHVAGKEAAEQLVRAAEQARTAAFERWAGPPPGPWQPVCDVYLYPTAADYAKATRQPAASPGHATYKAQGGTVSARRLDVRADDPNLLTAVVPHETTHLVLGDLFADAPLPRWADEGMAVLAEPRARVERYGRTLHTCRQRGQLVPLAQLMSQSEYPDAAVITPFYVESVSVVEYLVGLKGPKEFVAFLRDAQRGTLDAALQRAYGIRTVAELQEGWLRKTFVAADARASSQP